MPQAAADQSLAQATPKATCGPYALYVALNRLGHSISLKEASTMVPPSSKGAIFGDLRRAAMDLGHAAEFMELTWNELRQLGEVAILWVDEGHFITADPRERRADNDALIRSYEIDQAAKWCSQQQLESRWKGQSLVIWPIPLPKQVRGPHLQLDTSLQDVGFLETGLAEAECDFTLRNIGTEPLALTLIAPGCNLMKASLSSDKLMPGDCTNVRLRRKVTGTIGPFGGYTTLQTNEDPPNQYTLWINGSILNPLVTSCDYIYFGDILQGGSAERVAFVHDRGNRTLTVTEASLTFADRRLGEYVSSNINTSRITSPTTLPAGLSRISYSAGDYQINLNLTPGPDCPTGPLEAVLEIQTNQPGGYNHLRIPIHGQIVSDLYVEPSAVLLSHHQPQTTVQLARRSGKPVQIRQAHLRDASSIKLTEAATKESGKTAFLLTLSPEGHSPANGIIQTEVEFVLSSKTVRIPVSALTSQP